MTVAISRSSTTCSASAEISPFSRFALASFRAAVRNRLPTWSARNGGLFLFIKTGTQTSGRRLGGAGRILQRKTNSPSLFHDGLFVRIDDLATLVLGRIHNHLGFQIAEFIDAVALNILELGRQRSLFRPL